MDEILGATPSRDRHSPDQFEAMYRQSSPPWDIGRPQDAIVALADAGKIRGRVLDVGCGTGENVLFLAQRGFDVTGIDLAPTAIDRARQKAQDRSLAVTFEIADALDLGALGMAFDTIVDSGLFHVFDDADRRRYVASLAAALTPGGRYFMLAFSDEQPGTWGPRRIRQRRSARPSRMAGASTRSCRRRCRSIPRRSSRRRERLAPP